MRLTGKKEFLVSKDEGVRVAKIRKVYKLLTAAKKIKLLPPVARRKAHESRKVLEEIIKTADAAIEVLGKKPEKEAPERAAYDLAVKEIEANKVDVSIYFIDTNLEWNMRNDGNDMDKLDFLLEPVTDETDLNLILRKMAGLKMNDFKLLKAAVMAITVPE